MNHSEDAPQDFDIIQTRNKRDQYTIEIRKHKVEGMLKAKRLKLAQNLGNESNNNNLSTNYVTGADGQVVSFAELCKPFFDSLDAKDVDMLLKIVATIRHKLSVNDNPPIDEFLDTGLFLHILKFLESGYQNFTDLQYESLWIVSNCFAGPVDCTVKIITKSVLETLVKLIWDNRPNMVELTFWALANASADLDSVRLTLLEMGIIDTLNKYTKIVSQFSGGVLINISWLIANLAILKSHEEQFRPLFHIMKVLFAQNDKDIYSKICWAYANLTNGHDEELVKEMIDDKTLKKIIFLLDDSDVSTKLPAIRIVGNFLSLSSPCTKKVVEVGGFEPFERLLDHRKPAFRREGVWAVSNILADGPELIEKAIDTSILIKLLNAIILDIDQIKIEAMISFTNAINVGNFKQAKVIVRLGLARILGQALMSENEKVVLYGLSTAEAILEKGKLMQEEEKLDSNPFRLDMESEGTATFIEKLQYHRSDVIYGKVAKIIDTYFETQQQ